MRHQQSNARTNPPAAIYANLVALVRNVARKLWDHNNKWVGLEEATCAPSKPASWLPSRYSDGAGHADASNDANGNPNTAHLAPTLRHFVPPFF